MKSELVTATHQARKAVIYIRQSTPQQVMSHQESLRLQYALKERALAWGWPAERIETIDRDLGQTGNGLEGDLDADQVGRVVERGERNVLPDHGQHLFVDQGGFCKILSAVHHTMADPGEFRLIPVGPRLGQGLDDPVHPLSVIRHPAGPSCLGHRALAVTGFMLQGTGFLTDPFHEPGGENRPLAHVEQLVFD